MTGKCVDLSLPLTNETSVFPGDPKPVVNQTANVAEDGFSMHEFTFIGHIGTHIDAPAHFIEDGKTLAEISLERFSGEGILVDARDKKLIDIDILGDIKVIKDQIVFLRTDYSKNIKNKDYFKNYPVINETLAQKLVELQVKIVGIDGPSPDRDPWPVHKIFLSKEILIIENLCNLDKLPDKFKVYAFPLKVKTDGVPVRVVAEV